MGRSPDMIHLALHLLVSLWMASPFVYFLTAGAKTFILPAGDSGSVLGQISFVSGMVCVLGLGFYQALAWYQVLESLSKAWAGLPTGLKNSRRSTAVIGSRRPRRDPASSAAKEATTPSISCSQKRSALTARAAW
jgi:hypothetical protein